MMRKLVFLFVLCGAQMGFSAFFRDLSTSEHCQEPMNAHDLYWKDAGRQIGKV